VTFRIFVTVPVEWHWPFKNSRKDLKTMNNENLNMTREQGLPEDADKKLKVRTGVKAGAEPMESISMNFS